VSHRRPPRGHLSFRQVPSSRDIHKSSTRIFSVVMVLLGVALLVRTLVAGGGALSTGVLLGVLFVLAGAARLYLQLRG
jgi:multisubunit Na+/H+ antiporter MnhB subunit